MDEERSGNVDVVVEIIHCLIDCNLKHAYRKLLAAGWGLLMGGASFYLWGGHRSRGVAFLSSQKQHFLIIFLLEIDHLGDAIFSSFGVLKLQDCKSILYMRGG